MRKAHVGFRAVATIFVTLLVVCSIFAGSYVKAEDKKFTVGLSNGPFTHSWRVQMAESLRQEFEYYREKGWVDKLIIQNAGPDVNTQIVQIRNLIVSGVDLLLINPNSLTALNPVIEEAQEEGILVIVYDQPIDNPDVLNVFRRSEENNYPGLRRIFVCLQGV